ncbi:MAG: hypothetical protein AAF383_08165 [Cyanobacteria bacterium P01_A01_bin.83]
MSQINFSTSACRYCRFYEPHGRRGGDCQMLGVSVQSNWKACALASSPFKTTLTKLEDIFCLEPSIPLSSPDKLSFKTSHTQVQQSSNSIVVPKLE